MTRSLPEKTFEHWCSMHLSYRYKAKMLMWWPSKGADIETHYPSQIWGKRFWLELKTTEWKGNIKNPHHEISVDLVQLRKYMKQKTPVYYVFPIPEWNGVLAPSAVTPWLGSLAPEKLAYQSQSGDKWFAEWTIVIPGRTLFKALSGPIGKLLPSDKKKQHRIATINAGAIKWLTPIKSTSIPTQDWREFWAFMEKCGDANWPAQFMLPKNLKLATALSHVSIAKILADLAKDKKVFDGKVAIYNHIEGDQYAVQSDNSFPQSELIWGEGSRVMVALNEHALKL